MQTKTGLVAGLAYLRNQAFDAHLAGDGSRVVYLSTIALRGLEVAPQTEVETKNFRWALYLGLYWMTSDDFLFSAGRAKERLVDEEDKRGDRVLSDFLYHNIKRPPIDGFVEVPQLDESWLKEVSCDESAAVAICLAIELMWYSAPHSKVWRQHADRLLGEVMHDSPMEVGLQRLTTRLSVQQRLCFTGERLSGGDLDACTENHRQRLVAEGWKYFYADDYRGLQSTIERLTAVTSTTDAEHSALFYLAHFTRIQRASQEDQFVGLERLRDSTRAQPSAAVAALRDLRFGRQYAKVARRGFAGTQASARWDCLTMSMLSQLAGLRNWHLAEWITARRDTASVLVETACHGEPALASLGIDAYVSSLDIPKTGEQPFFDAAFELLDAFPEHRRRTLVDQTLSVPRAGEEVASRVLERLADAIPAEALPDVAVWCNRIELRRHDSPSWQSHLAWWTSVLHCSDASARLADALRPVAEEKAGSQFAWQKLGDFLFTYVINASDEAGEAVLNRLLEAEVDKTKISFEDERNAIVMTVAEHRVDFAEKCAAWLRPRLEAKPNDIDSQWMLYHLDHRRNEWQELIDDEGLRSLLVKKVQEFFETQEVQPPNQHSLVPYNYHVRFYECLWPTLPLALVDRLKTVVADANTPLMNKPVFICCLAALCQNATQQDADGLADYAIELARSSVAGQDLLPTSNGPLSTLRITGGGVQSVEYAVCRFLAAAARNCTLEGLKMLSLLADGAEILESDNVRPLAFQFALTLSVRLAATESTDAVQLASMAESFAARVSTANADGLIYSFHEIMFCGHATEAVRSSRENFVTSEAARLTWQCWSRRLVICSMAASASLRQAVATVLANCEAYDSAKLTPPLSEALARLRKDCRMRVRNAAARIEPTETTLDLG